MTFYTPALKKSGGILFYLCLSVSPSICQTIHSSIRQLVRSSHEYFSSHLSQVLHHKDFWNWVQRLNKSAIPCAFSDSSLKNFQFTEHLYYFTHDSQVENFRHIFLRNYNTRISEIRFQGLHKSAIPCDTFSDSSPNNFLLTKIFGRDIISEQ